MRFLQPVTIWTWTRGEAMTIWKFPAGQTLRVPAGARWLSAQIQRGEVMAWAVVDPEAEAEEWRIHQHGTGSDAPSPDDVYLGTVQEFSWSLIWHVFAHRVAR